MLFWNIIYAIPTAETAVQRAFAWSSQLINLWYDMLGTHGRGISGLALCSYQVDLPLVPHWTGLVDISSAWSPIRSGAAEAWRAHNPQVPGSKPGSENGSFLLLQC